MHIYMSAQIYIYIYICISNDMHPANVVLWCWHPPSLRLQPALGYEIEERGRGQESGDGGSINGVYPQVMASKQ